MRRLPPSRLDILRQHLHAAHQIVAVGRQRLAQHFRIGENEIRRRQRVGDLLDVELGFLAGVRVEPFGFAHEIVRPPRRQQIGLHHEIEKLVRLPFGIGEPLVARRGRNRGRRFLADQAPHRRAPEVQIGLAQLHLQFGGAGLVRQPIVRHRAEGLDHLAEFAGRLVLGLAVVARLEIGRERLAAALHRLRKIHRERFRIERFCRLGFGCDVAHGLDTTESFQVRHGDDRGWHGSQLIRTVLQCDKASLFGHIGAPTVRSVVQALIVCR